MTCGLSPQQVSVMSFAQLKLWHRAAERRRAENGLIGLKVMQAAFASVMCKEGNDVVRQVSDELRKLL